MIGEKFKYTYKIEKQLFFVLLIYLLIKMKCGA